MSNAVPSDKQDQPSDQLTETYRIVENTSVSAGVGPCVQAEGEQGNLTGGAKRKVARLTSLDAFRGFIMLLLAAHGFGIYALSRSAADSPLSEIVNRENLEYWAFHFQHPTWQSSFVPGTRDPRIGSPWLHVGVSFWDLIQPAFMMMVGAAIPFSYGRREVMGQSRNWRFLHTIRRSSILILMGVFLYSLSSSSTQWIFPNVLCQIGLGYTWVTLLLNRPRWVQVVSLAVVLVGTWIAMHVYQPAAEIDLKALNVSVEKGEVFEAPYYQWSKNVNVFHEFDVWFLNLFPRPESAGPFKFSYGGYQTLNFVPSMATMILGLIAGEILISSRQPRRKFWILMGMAVGCIALGVAAGATCCPTVKRIWTPSWALLSGGYVIGMLALFYLVFDLLPFRRFAFPFVVVGMNSIVVYFMGELLTKWLAENVLRHFGWLIEAVLGWFGNALGLLKNAGIPAEEMGATLMMTFSPVVNSLAALSVIWLTCYWLYRQRIFIRV